MNQIQFKSKLIKAITEHFVNKMPFDVLYNNGVEDTQITISTVDDFKKVISDGQISNETGQQQKIVLYKEDYQSENDTTFDQTIDAVTQCFCRTEVSVDPNDPYSHTCSGGYYDDSDWPAETGLSSILLSEDYDNDTYLDRLVINLGVFGSCSGTQTLSIGSPPTVLLALSQYISFDDQQINIDPIQAGQVLDTNIYELLPDLPDRQRQINKFFSDYANLKSEGGSYPSFQDTNPADGLLDTPSVEYDSIYDISSGGEYITRLAVSESNVNQNKSLEWLRNDLNEFLKDVDQEYLVSGDGRPIYTPKSSGYLKIRNLNQAIIVRNEEKDDIGLVGEDSDIPLWLEDGFTITMWVRFLDRVNSGTLFNFINPLRQTDPAGFMLETFTVHRDEYESPPEGFFVDNDYERFLRLVVREENIGEGYVSGIRDSHFGITGQDRLNTTVGGDTTELPALEHSLDYAFNHTRVPIDFNEWYFIVATYNPGVQEDTSYTNFMNANDYAPDGITALKNSPEFWRWNVNPVDGNTGTYTHFSNHGAKCKVEIISKSDLLLARGYGINETT